jgi:hypothetical protein
VDDLTRFAEGGLLSESAIRKKWRLSEDVWEKLGADDELVRAIDKNRIQRIRNGAFKRERSQQLVTKAPDVLSNLLLNEKNSPKHRIDAAKTLDAFAANGPEATVEQERFFIRIDLSADTRDPKDVLTIEATPRPGTSKRIEDDHREQPSDEWRR